MINHKDNEWLREYERLQAISVEIIGELKDSDPDKLRYAVGSVVFRKIEAALAIKDKEEALCQEMMMQHEDTF